MDGSQMITSSYISRVDLDSCKDIYGDTTSLLDAAKKELERYLKTNAWIKRNPETAISYRDRLYYVDEIAWGNDWNPKMMCKQAIEDPYVKEAIAIPFPKLWLNLVENDFAKSYQAKSTLYHICYVVLNED